MSHSFPDPIPPGIMEEACDWDVIIEPPSKPSRKVPVSPKQEKKKRVKSEATLSKPSKASHIPHSIEERRTCDKSYGAETKAKNHSKLRMEKPLPSATNLETRLTLTQADQSDTLPKIPALPSFKSRARKIMSFTEAEADYESFITEGPGRSVEIIRQYEGDNRSPNMFNSLQSDHDDGGNESCVPDASHSHQDLALPPDVSELTSGSKSSEVSMSSDDDGSSSESKMEVESESNSSVPNRSSQHRHHTRVLPDKDVSNTHSSVDSNEHQQDQSSAARIQTHSSRNKQMHKPQSHNPPHHKGPTASKSSRKATTTRQIFTEEKNDDVEEEVAGQDYWNAYRAWVEYYNSYYHRSPYYWMRAFSTYSNYMTEMMKR